MNQPQVHMCLPILKPTPTSLPIAPSGLSQSTSFECPASGIELAAVIYFIFLFVLKLTPLSKPEQQSSLRSSFTGTLGSAFFVALCYHRLEIQ